MTHIVKLPFGDVKAAQAVVDAMVKLTGDKHPVLKDLRRDVFYGGTVWVAYLGPEANEPLSVHCTKLGKRKKNAWEPVANWYTAYTTSHRRRSGYATALYMAMEADAVAAGCRRIKSLAGSGAGLGLHKHLGHACWGLTENNEVWVDSALPGYEHFYTELGTPPQAPGQLLSNSELKHLIKKGLRYDHLK